MVLLSKFRTLLYLIKEFRRERFILKLRKRLMNKEPSIISINCIGGVVYHNLGLRFLSPTVNLYFDEEDFFVFVENLRGFIDSDLVQVVGLDVDYPVGRLTFDDKNVIVHFMHYDTFNDAKQKWNERKQRINFDNIYIIHMISDASDADLDRFNCLNYKNKLMISNCNPKKYKDVYVHKVFSQSDYFPGKILKFKGKYAYKTYLDDIDYVAFLNKK